MSDEAEYTMGLERQLQELRTELSARRAAQPLTREGIDVVISMIYERDYKTTGPSYDQQVAMYRLRDALLDSLDGIDE